MKHDLMEALDAMKKLSPLLLAGAGYLFTYYNSKVGKEREAQIDRVNEQVKDLYGPLLSCVTASKSAFDAMIGQHSPDGTKAGFVRAIKENPDSAEAVAYRQWMKEVLQPLNDKAANAIVDHIDLIEASSVDPLLLKLVAYVKTVRVMMSRWEAGNTNEWSALTYPDEVLPFVVAEFKRMKERQAQLLGFNNRFQTIQSKL
ncbi:hypothetical protein WJX77_012309 [Trebouxia sp. C0004]